MPKIKTKLPDINYLKEYLQINEDGTAQWRSRPRFDFKNLQSFVAWNKRNSGKKIFSKDGNGYLLVPVFGKNYRLHRVIYFMNFPEFDQNMEIDHKNGIKTDNRISNLRACTPSQNSMNMKTPSDNSSGHKGISWSKEKDSWHAYINVEKKRIQKRFKSLEAAVTWRKSMLIMHGEFANDGTMGEIS